MTNNSHTACSRHLHNVKTDGPLAQPLVVPRHDLWSNTWSPEIFLHQLGLKANRTCQVTILQWSLRMYRSYVSLHLALFTVKAFPHFSHLNGLSPVWTLKCLWRSDGAKQSFPQYGHEYGPALRPPLECKWRWLGDVSPEVLWTASMGEDHWISCWVPFFDRSVTRAYGRVELVWQGWESLGVVSASCRAIKLSSLTKHGLKFCLRMA